MKSIFVLFVAFAIALPAQGFLLDTINNAVNSVTNTVNNIVTTTQNTISTANLIGQILWDNAFGPSLEMFLNNGADFIDNYFGDILNAVGKKREAEIRLSFSMVVSAFEAAAGQLIAEFKVLFQGFVDEAIQLVTGSLIQILFGSTTFNAVFDQILTKFKGYINVALQNALSLFVATVHGISPEVSSAITTITEFFSNGASAFEHQLTQLSSIASQALILALSVLSDEFEDLMVYLKAQISLFIADVNKIIASSLIGFLFGTTTIDGIFKKLISKFQEYVVNAANYALSYASDKFIIFYLNFENYFLIFFNFVNELNLSQFDEPLLDQVANFFQNLYHGELNLPTIDMNSIIGGLFDTFLG